MTNAAAGQTWLWRTLGLVVVYDVWSLVLRVATTPRGPRSRPDPALWLDWLSQTPLAMATVAAVASAGALWMLRRRYSAVGPAIALVAMALLNEASTVADDIHVEWYTSGVMLLGWLVGTLYGRMAARGQTPTTIAKYQAACADSGAVAGLAGLFLNAGLSKWMRSGADWFEPGSLWFPVAGHYRFSGSGLGHWARTFVLEQPLVAQLGALYGTGIELAMPLALLGGRWRVVLGLGLAGLFVSVALLLGIWNLQTLTLATAVAAPWFWWPGRGTQPEPDTEDLLSEASRSEVAQQAQQRMPQPDLNPSFARRWLVAIGITMVSLAWLLPVRDWMRVQPDANLKPWVRLAPRTPDRPPLSPPEEPAGTPLAQETPLVGPAAAWLASALPDNDYAGLRVVGRFRAPTGVVQIHLATATTSRDQTVVVEVTKRCPAGPTAPVTAGDLALWYQAVPPHLTDAAVRAVLTALATALPPGPGAAATLGLESCSP